MHEGECWGGGLGNKRCWKGVGAEGGHFKWPVVAAVTGPYTHTPREGSSCMWRAPGLISFVLVTVGFILDQVCSMPSPSVLCRLNEKVV